MKPSFECLRCLLTIRLREVENSRASSEEKLETARRVLSLAESSFGYEAELTHLATDLYNTLTTLLPSVVDYYKKVKRELNELAIRSLGLHQDYATGLDGPSRFRYLVKLSALGNLIDLGVAGHNHINPEALTPGLVEGYEFCIDDTVELYEAVSRGGLRVLWLFDNAGEAVYDTLLIREVKRYGNTVWGLVKDEPGFQNDVTIEDAALIGLDRVLDRVASYGCRCSTVHLEKLGDEARRLVKEADVVVAKGMSHYEYLSEVDLGKQVFFILIPKCPPVARSLGDPKCQGKIVVLRKE
ncbi:damage-control phosphatase ARMT1 family protein [Thermogladius calderae]|nr:ARMT1-like domain-containing protein [Thermogladius calderae]